MKLIKYWHVKLFQHIGTVMIAGKLEKLIHEGYSTSKPALNYHENSVIELFTAPDQLETKTIRTYGIDSMVCTPVYEEEKGKVHDHACLNCFTGTGPCTGECNVTDTNKVLADSFEAVTKPVIKWLNENSHPHAIIVIDPTGATLHTGEIGYQTEEFLKD